MPTTILVGLVAAALLAAVARLVIRTPQPPQIIYVQVAPAEPQAQPGGCLPLLVLLLVVLVALALS
jgi:hypothetical protein